MPPFLEDEIRPNQSRTQRGQKSAVQLSQYGAAYIDKGAPDKPVLLFFHGFLGESSLWVPLMERLMAQYRCIALDMLRFGASSKPKLNYIAWRT